MPTVSKILVGLAALAFLLAVFSSLVTQIMAIPPESFSRAANNLALIAIAVALVFKEEAKAA